MGTLGVIFLTVLLDLLGFGIVIPLLTFYAEDYGATPLQVTLLMACYSLAQFLFAPMWGAISDRVGRRPVLLLSIGMAALMLAGFAWADRLALLFLFRTLHGMFAANISTAQAYVADVTRPEDRAKGMGLIGAAFGVGFSLGPWVGGELSTFGLSAPIWLAAGLSAVNFLLALVLLPESRKRSGEHHPRPLHPFTWLSVLRHPVVGGLVAVSFCLTIAFAMMESTFALFEEHVHGMTARDVGRLLGGIGVVMVVIQGGLIGRLAHRFGERRLLLTGLPGLALSLVALAYSPPVGPLWTACLLLGVFHGLAQPSLYSLMSRAASADDQGLVLGTNQSLSALARTVGPALGGLLFGSVAEAAPFLTAAAVLGGAWLLAAWAVRRAGRRSAASPPGSGEGAAPGRASSSAPPSSGP